METELETQVLFLRYVLRLLATANLCSSPIFVTLMMEAIHYFELLFLQEPHGVTSQKMVFFLAPLWKPETVDRW
jgi:hypothetical protein